MAFITNTAHMAQVHSSGMEKLARLGEDLRLGVNIAVTPSPSRCLKGDDSESTLYIEPGESSIAGKIP